MKTRAILISLALLAVPTTAVAGWHASGGNGRSYSKASTVAAGSTPTVSVDARNVSISWSAVGGQVPVTGYVVRRFADGGAEATVGAGCAGTVAALSCTESNVPAGTWRYTVTPARHNWRGAQSPQSAAVTVTAPSLQLSPATVSCLPDSLSGQIQSFAAGQTVTFRLDHPTTGQALAGSIAPSPVPASGTASASVTVPSGIADGAHTVYAVGSGGDVASAPLTVGTSGMRVATGSYAGNGADNRNLDTAGFQPDLVIIKGNTTGFLPSRTAVISTATMAADRSKQLGEAFGTFPNAIQAFRPNGFQVGSDARVNASGPTYYWTALKSKAGHMALGTYGGNGASGRAITGLGFSPEYAFVIAEDIALNEQSPVQRMAGMTRTFPFDAGGGTGIPGTGSTAAITSLDSGGFTLGAEASVNRSGTAYHYAAFNECAGEMKAGTYSGNGATSRQITGVGFQPAYAIVRANDTSTARQGVHRPAAVGSTGSQLFGNLGNITNGITALQSGGFQIGNHAGTNASGVSYPYVAFRDKP